MLWTPKKLTGVGDESFRGRGCKLRKEKTDSRMPLLSPSHPNEPERRPERQLRHLQPTRSFSKKKKNTESLIIIQRVTRGSCGNWVILKRENVFLHQKDVLISLCNVPQSVRICNSHFKSLPSQASPQRRWVGKLFTAAGCTIPL